MVSIIVVMVAVVLLALVFIAAAAAIKSEPQQGGEVMIRKVYVYLVLFATLMMVIGGSVSAFMAAADLVAPAPYHQTYAEFRQYGSKETAINPDSPNISEEEWRARYQTIVDAEKQRQADRAKNSLIKSLGWVIIPLPVFVFFQRRLSSPDNRE